GDITKELMIRQLLFLELLKELPVNKLKFIFLLNCLVFVSCHTYEKIYLNDRKELDEKDKYDSNGCSNCLFIVFENSMNGSKVKIKDIKTPEDDDLEYGDTMTESIFFDKIIEKNKITSMAELVETRNNKIILLKINHDSVVIPRFTYPVYRFIIVKKIGIGKKKYSLTFTNSFDSSKVNKGKIGLEVTSPNRR
ncbi:hypothetical protein, partial [Flavobacterium noncentrifugens]